MFALLRRLKLPFEIASVVIGVVLGGLAVWQQLKPNRDLVGELVVSKARLPGDFLEDAKNLPENVSKALLKDEGFKKLLPQEKTRLEVVDKVKDTVDRHSSSLHSFNFARGTFMAVTVRNEGDKPLKGVKLGFRYPLAQAMTIVLPDGSSKNLESKGLVDLGDLPPHGEINVFSWGIAVLISNQRDVTLSHQDGIGEIRMLYPVPEFIWGNEGIFFSYRHTTYALLGIMLFAIGLAGLSRYRSTRNAKTRNGKSVA